MPRLYLTAREYDALLKRQRGKCCVRGCKTTEGLIAEHSTPNATIQASRISSCADRATR
jgi:hypothetical protein